MSVEETAEELFEELVRRGIDTSAETYAAQLMTVYLAAPGSSSQDETNARFVAGLRKLRAAHVRAIELMETEAF
jgi:hypothetical protein